MLIASPARVLRAGDIPVVLDAALSILEKTGVAVENDGLLSLFVERGAIVDRESRRARFPRRLIEDMLESAQRASWSDMQVELRTFAGVYQGWYLDLDGEFLPWTHRRVLDYARLAQSLPNVENMFMLGYPVAGVPDLLRPLYEKLYCWLYGMDGGKSIWETSLCGPIHDMWQVYAAAKGVPAGDLFNGTVYLISPLRFGKEEAAQFWYFREKGLRVTVGQLGSLGVTTPVTFAGALALHLAEGLFINYLNHVCFGEDRLHLYNSISAVDMSTGAFQYGRPEQVLLNTAGAQMAAHLGASFEGHAGLTDAKTPGYESAAQKVYSAMSGALCYGSGILEAGLLSIDEVNSPLQMILDDEAAGAMAKTFEPVAVDGDTLGLDSIDALGPGGNFMDSDHTFEHFRDALWFPTLWSRESFTMWRAQGEKNDLDRAKDKYHALMAAGTLEERLPAGAKADLEKIIGKVGKGANS